MNGNNNNNRKPTVINVGGASLMMLFAVLCLTVFSVLSLVYSNYQVKLTEKAVLATENYYAADTSAAEIFEALQNGDLSEATVTEENGITYYSYSVTVDADQTLDVVVANNGGALTIESWKVVNNAAEVNLFDDDAFNLWDGN